MPAAPDAGEIPQPGEQGNVPGPDGPASDPEYAPFVGDEVYGPPTLVGHQYAGQSEVLVDGIWDEVQIEVGTAWFIFSYLPLRTIGVVGAGDAVGGSAVVSLTEELSPDLLVRAINVVGGVSYYGAPRAVLDPGERRGRPWIPAHPAVGATRVAVRGKPPGARARVRDVNGVLLGIGLVGPNGVASVDVGLVLEDERLRAAGGGGQVDGGLHKARELGGLPWPAPRIGTLYAGQTAVRIEGLRPGCRTAVLLVGAVIDSREFTPAESEKWLEWNLAPLVAGDDVFVWQTDDFGKLSGTGDTTVSSVSTAVPFIRPVLRDGDVILRVGGQVPGHHLVISVDGRVTGMFRPSGRHEEVEISPPLVAGAMVTVSQRSLTLGEGDRLSEPVLVEPGPPLSAPTLVPYLFGGATRALVLFAERGATVRLTRDDGMVIGEAWTGNHTSVEVLLLPTVEVGDNIEIQQFTGRYNFSPEPGQQAADDYVTVVAAPDPLPTPAILPPAFEGDDRVVVAGNPPGALVEVQALLDDGSWCSLGSAILPDPHGVVQLAIPIPAGATLRAGSWWDGPTFWGPELVAVPDPGATGPWEVKVETIVDALGVAVGELTTPVDGLGALVVTADAAFVVVVHGDAPLNTPAASFTGYRWLAEHLASQGMVVWCPDSDSVITTPETVEASTAVLRADPRWSTFESLDLALFAHSFGWPKAPAWLATLSPQPPVRAVVGLGAATESFDVEVPPGVPALLVSAPQDYALTGNGALSGYDSLGRPRMAMLVKGANHFGWNTQWSLGARANQGGFFDDSNDWPVGSIDEEAHHDVGRAMFPPVLRLKGDFFGWWRVFAGQLPPLARAGPELRTLIQAPDVLSNAVGDATATATIHAVDFVDEITNALGLRSDGFRAVEILLTSAAIQPGNRAFDWDVVAASSGIVETLGALAVGYLSLAVDSAWVVQGSSVTLGVDDASPTTAVEPVLSVFSAGTPGPRPVIRLLPQNDLPAGFGMAAAAEFPDANPRLPDDLAMAQTRAFPARAFLGLEPGLDLSQLSEARMEALRTATSAHGAIFALEAWCVPLP